MDDMTGLSWRQSVIGSFDIEMQVINVELFFVSRGNSYIIHHPASFFVKE